MEKITVAELKNNTSEAIVAAQMAPVSIEENGRLVAVIIAQSDYERFTQLESDYWLTRAEKAEKTGYIGTNPTASFIRQISPHIDRKK